MEEYECVVLTRRTMDLFLRSRDPADAIALYSFYCYTAKWQKTNRPKCTTGYAAKGLKWGVERVRAAKKELLGLGLAEDYCGKDDGGRIAGHFIKLNFLVGGSPVGEPSVGGSPVGEQSVGGSPVGEQSVGEPPVGDFSVAEAAVGEPPVGEQSAGEPPVGEVHPTENPQCGADHARESAHLQTHPTENPQCGADHACETSSFLNHPTENPRGGESHGVEEGGTNALRDTNRNALGDNIKIIVGYLNERTGSHYRPDNKATQRHINARLSEGYSPDELKAVIDKKTEEWRGTEWEKYLRPETLFGPKFEGYLNAPRAAPKGTRGSLQGDMYAAYDKSPELFIDDE